jgi:hypothetical protein
MDEFAVSVISGIDYEGVGWGMNFYMTVDLYTDTKISGALIVLDEEYSLKADKRHPVEVGASAWLGVGEGVNKDAWRGCPYSCR